MILYLDTSALVKRYFLEPYTDDIISKWKSAHQIVTSFVTYAETMASIYRKKREARLQKSVIRSIEESFYQDWLSFVRVEVNDDLNEYISHLVQAYPLRGFDAVHLASAMVVRERIPHGFVFACFDSSLVRAARSEGMETFPPSDEMD
ncbi:MAG: type II toxin-antitoxin system VapC family toxin [Deltaproteobacteria bacterium]|nr:type II toxin-antitoxin system VapC family toxin [Deltaproteobacteria bacterium]